MNPQPQPNVSPGSNGEPHADFLRGLANVDAAIAGEASQDPLNLAMEPGAAIPPASSAPAEPGYFAQVVPSMVGAALDVAKKAGWSSPAVEPLLTEKDWIAQVSGAAVHTLEKYVPTAAGRFDSELVLLGLVGPWIVSNIYETIQKSRREKNKPAGARKPAETAEPGRGRSSADIDFGLDRNRENNLAKTILSENPAPDRGESEGR